jgi:hypothetical protein
MKYLFIITTCSIVTLSSVFAGNYTRGYYRQNGTYVPGYYHSSSNDSLYDNYGTRGNINPYTGAYGTRDPYMQHYGTGSLRQALPGSGW